MTITSSDLQHGFKFEVTAMPGGELVKRCLDCGACTGVCPVSQSEAAFDPRRILHMIRMGLKDRLLGSEAIWHCSHCDTCAFVCPQDVQFSGVTDVLREMALKEGYVDTAAFEQWGTGPCKASCPAHISIAGFIAAIAQGRYAEGLRLIKKEMPFPAICGRVCHHPCEGKCNRGKLDEPIAIEYLKRFLADVDLSSDVRYLPEIKGKQDEKVAIVGAGPAGLTAAYYLAIEGYQVTVFERLPVAGGMMAVGIPEYRLPRDTLRAEIQTIADMGVEIKTGVTFGKDITMEGLRKDGYKAFFVAVGLHVSRSLNVEGENLAGILHGIAFLKDVSLKKGVTTGERTIVIGGGNVAIDVALAALRTGAREVRMVCLEAREEMPAWEYEIKDAMDEGVTINNSWGPRRFTGENGQVKIVEFKRCTAVFDGEGRFNPQYDESELMTLEADTVLIAIGQACDMSFAAGVPDLEVSPRGPVVTNPLTLETNVAGLFVGGDASYGPRSVVEAVASGKEAAISIDRYLRGEDIRAGRSKEWKGIEFEPEHVEHAERQPMPRLPLAERNRTFKELDLGFNEEQARREADRCLRLCGIQRGKNKP